MGLGAKPITIVQNHTIFVMLAKFSKGTGRLNSEHVDEQVARQRLGQHYCSRSRRRAANGSKRMYLDYTHGLFIT